MASRSQAAIEPRKTPVQARSAATVQAIYEATIQVLLHHGPERLTTIRVAKRAGVSVGTLYQYYPNKQALLFAVLERHLAYVSDAVVQVCDQNHHEPLPVMVEAVVQAFVRAKLEQRDTALALYRIASELGSEKLIARLRKRSLVAMVAMLKTAPEGSPPELEFATFMLFSAMAGATRAVLEAGAPAAMTRKLPRHLTLIGQSYLALPLITRATPPPPAHKTPHTAE